MLNGTVSISRVIEESVCRSTKSYRFTDLGLYQIHSTSLMPEIPFGESQVYPCNIDDSIFINDDATMPNFQRVLNCQNFLTTRYIGRAPLEWYAGGNMTELGRQFVLKCDKGNPNADHRVFGTEGAIHTYNRDANTNVSMPGGGE